jgi:uncharacterized damage-inducible protein DinB
MKTKINRIIQTLEDIFKGEVWYGDSMIDIITSIAPKDAISKNVTVDKSILEVVYHMVQWRLFTIKALEQEEPYDIELNSTKDWKYFDKPTEKEWSKQLKLLLETQKDLIDILQELKDEDLQTIAANRSYTLEFLVNGIIQHDIYHLGQISIIHRFIKNKAGFSNN